MWPQIRRREICHSPALFTLQQSLVGGNLDVQGQLDVEQLLVVPQHAGQLILGLLQSILQLNVLLPGIFEGTIAALLNVTDGGLQAGDLSGKDNSAGVCKASYPSSWMLWVWINLLFQLQTGKTHQHPILLHPLFTFHPGPGADLKSSKDQCITLPCV